MKKFFLSFFTIMLCIMFTDISFEAKAFGPLDGMPTVVMGTTADGFVLLDNDAEITQDDFHHYSGNDFDLKAGDVIRVNCDTVLECSPSIYCFDCESPSSIDYLGTIYELEPENIKTLTLSEIVEDDWIKGWKQETGNTGDYGERIWKDENGKTYRLDLLENRAGMRGESEKYEQPLYKEDYEIGDKALCYVGSPRAGFVLEKFDTAEDVAEKLDAAPVSIIAGDADGNGEVEMIDMIAVNKYLMIGAPLSDAGIKAADMNGDGEIGQDDGLCILQTVLGLMA